MEIKKANDEQLSSEVEAHLEADELDPNSPNVSVLSNGSPKSPLNATLDANDDVNEKKQKQLEKSLKLWSWSAIESFNNNKVCVWTDIADKEEYVQPVEGEEKVLLDKLFSKGPEVAFTVATNHQRLRHFTSEDFSGMRSTSKRNDMESSMVDLQLTKKAVQTLPHVQAALKVSPLSSAGPFTSSQTPVKQSRDAVTSADQEEEQESLILPYSRLVQLKQEGKLASVNVKPHCLENYLADDEFEKVFSITRMDFNKLPGWKREKSKKAAKLF